MRYAAIAGTLSVVMLAAVQPAAADDAKELSSLQRELIRVLDAKRADLIACNQDIWSYAELGLQEFKSAARLTGMLEDAGFRVKRGVAGMPTAFVAEYGSGKPIIGLLAEYDALPGLSQQAVPHRSPDPSRDNGHACGHSAFGTAIVGAAIAVREVYETHGIKGTLRVYGTPAEETLIGKVYMTLDGQFDDLDAVLHWHPGADNKIKYQTSKAMISAKFAFTGLPAHAAGSPTKGRSALDAVELMNVGVNYMREHIKETSRIHYVITDGGGAPNVVPPFAEVWYFIRANKHEDAEFQFDWIRDIAEAAAKMTRTEVAVKIDTDCHELIPNLPLSKLVERNFRLVGPPQFDDADEVFARGLQKPLRDSGEITNKRALEDKIEAVPRRPYPASGGSTDVGDISWHVPTSGLSTACFPIGSPGHSWQNVASIGSPIGHKGMMVAAKVLALTAADLMTDSNVLTEARADFQKRTKDLKYTTRIPPGQKAPASIR